LVALSQVTSPVNVPPAKGIKVLVSTVAHVRPPESPDCLDRNCPLDPALLIFNFSSLTTFVCIAASTILLVAGTLTDVAAPIKVTNTLAPAPGTVANLIVSPSTRQNPSSLPLIVVPALGFCITPLTLTNN